MPFFAFLITFLLSTLLGELLRPSPHSPAARPPPDQSTFKFPTVSAGRPVQVVYGTVRQEGVNILWWGNYRTIAVVSTQKVKTGLFSKKTITTVTGYRFFFTIAVSLGHAGVQNVRQFLVEEKTAWSGNLTPGTSTSVNAPNLFGGLDKDGGYVGGLWFRSGTLLAIAAASGQSSIGYQNLSYMTWDGEIGTNPFIRRWSFISQRKPNALGASHVNGCNPVELFYDVLTNPLYGASMAAGDIDTTNFQAVGAVLAAEGLGLSFEWDQRRRVNDFLSDQYKVIDAVGFVSHLTGLYTLKLVRADFSIGSIPSFDASSISEVKGFARTAWDQTVNEVKVVWTNPARGYKEDTAQAQDLANFQIQGRIVSTQLQFPQITTAGTAAAIAWRELKSGSYPLAKCTFIMNRTAYKLQPGDAFKVAWAPLGITSMVFRATRIKLGQLRDGKIEVEAIQDVFSTEASQFAAPTSTTWIAPLSSATPVTVQTTLEVPYQYFADDPERDPLNVPSENRIMLLTAKPSGSTITAETQERISPATEWETDRGRFDGFPPTGTLRDPYGASYGLDGSATLVVQATNGFEAVADAASYSAMLAENVNLVLLGTELLAFQDVTDNLDGTYTLNQVVRGAWDTVPTTHSVGDRLWVFYYGRSVTIPAFGDTDVVDLRQVPATPIDVLDPTLATPITHPITRRSVRPYPPGNVKLNGVAAPVYPPATNADYLHGDLSVTWSHRNRLGQTGLVRQDDAANYGPEAGTTYTVRIRNGSDTLIRTDTGLTGTSYSRTWAQLQADNGGTPLDTLRIELESVVGALTSAQFQTRKGQWSGYGFNYGQDYGG